MKPSDAHDAHNSGLMPNEANVLDDTSTPFSGGGEAEPEADLARFPSGDCDRDGPADDDATEDMSECFRGISKII